MAKRKSFETWMKEVNAALVAKYGMTSDDLPDCDYWTWWDSGTRPQAAANRAAKNAGANF